LVWVMRSEEAAGDKEADYGNDNTATRDGDGRNRVRSLKRGVVTGKLEDDCCSRAEGCGADKTRLGRVSRVECEEVRFGGGVGES